MKPKETIRMTETRDKPKRRALDVADVAEALDVGLATAYEACRSGILKDATFRVGKRIKISAAAFDRIVDRAK
jgi:hypothetical protein